MEEKQKKAFGLVLLVTLLAVVSPVYATIGDTEYFQTEAFFNVEENPEITLTLPGETPVTSTTGEGTTTTDIELNATSVPAYWVNATVVGGSAQDADVPIFNYSNTGTTQMNITVYINASMPDSTCTIDVFANNTSTNMKIGQNITVASGLILTQDLAAGNYFPLWIWANFSSGCSSGDSTPRNITSNVTQSA